MKIIVGGRHQFGREMPRLRRDIPFHVTFIPEIGDSMLGGLLKILLLSQPYPIINRHALTFESTEQTCFKCSADGRACVELLDQNIWSHDFANPVEICLRVRCQQGHLSTRTGYFTLAFEYEKLVVRTKGFRVCGAGEKKKKAKSERGEHLFDEDDEEFYQQSYLHPQPTQPQSQPQPQPQQHSSRTSAAAISGIYPPIQQSQISVSSNGLPTSQSRSGLPHQNDQTIQLVNSMLRRNFEMEQQMVNLIHCIGPLVEKVADLERSLVRVLQEDLRDLRVDVLELFDTKRKQQSDTTTSHHESFPSDDIQHVITEVPALAEAQHEATDNLAIPPSTDKSKELRQGENISFFDSARCTPSTSQTPDSTEDQQTREHHNGKQKASDSQQEKARGSCGETRTANESQGITQDPQKSCIVIDLVNTESSTNLDSGAENKRTGDRILPVSSVPLKRIKPDPHAEKPFTALKSSTSAAAIAAAMTAASMALEKNVFQTKNPTNLRPPLPPPNRMQPILACGPAPYFPGHDKKSRSNHSRMIYSLGTMFHHHQAAPPPPRLPPVNLIRGSGMGPLQWPYGTPYPYISPTQQSNGNFLSRMVANRGESDSDYETDSEEEEEEDEDEDKSERGRRREFRVAEILGGGRQAGGASVAFQNPLRGSSLPELTSDDSEIGCQSKQSKEEDRFSLDEGSKEMDEFQKVSLTKPLPLILPPSSSSPSTSSPSILRTSTNAMSSSASVEVSTLSAPFCNACSSSSPCRCSTPKERIPQAAKVGSSPFLHNGNIVSWSALRNPVVNSSGASQSQPQSPLLDKASREVLNSSDAYAQGGARMIGTNTDPFRYGSIEAESAAYLPGLMHIGGQDSFDRPSNSVYASPKHLKFHSAVVPYPNQGSSNISFIPSPSYFPLTSTSEMGARNCGSQGKVRMSTTVSTPVIKRKIQNPLGSILRANSRSPGQTEIEMSGAAGKLQVGTVAEDHRGEVQEHQIHLVIQQCEAQSLDGQSSMLEKQ